MRSKLVALCAATTISFAICQGHAQSSIQPHNSSVPKTTFPPPECSPCEGEQKTCTFNNNGEFVCAPPDSNETTDGVTPGTEPEITHDTLLTAFAPADMSGITTELRGDATAFAMTTSVARTAESTVDTTEASISRTAQTTYATCNIDYETRCGNVCCGADEECASPGVCTPDMKGATATYGPSGTGPLRPLETIEVANGKHYEHQGLDLGYWCDDQMDTCPLLCGGEPAANECYSPEELDNYDPNVIEVLCVCADGSVPDRAQYLHTIEDHICQQDRDNCLNKLLSKDNHLQEDQNKCFKKACGEADVRVPPFNSTASPTDPDVKPDTVITAQTTTIAIPNIGLPYSNYRGSIVSAQKPTTILKLQCDYNDPEMACSEAIPTMTLTVGPNAATMYGARGSSAVWDWGCTWTAIQNRTCLLQISTDGDSGAEAYTLGSADPKVSTLTVTAGAYKLAQPTASGSGNGSGLTSGDGSGLEVGMPGGSRDGDTGISVWSVSKKNAAISVEVGASSALVALVLMLVLAL